MPHYNVSYKIKGLTGILDNVPNKENPVYSHTLSGLMAVISNSPLLNPSPTAIYAVEVIGVQIVECPSPISEAKPS